MEFIYTADGIEYMVAYHDNESRQQMEYQQRNLLLEKYRQLLANTHTELTPAREKALLRIVDNMTEASAGNKLKVFSAAQANRMLTYAMKFSEAGMGNLGGMAKALTEVLDAVAEDDTDNEETVEVNGNKFVYDKSRINIRDHISKLHAIGEQSKGNTWSVYLDEEGEMVIY